MVHDQQWDELERNANAKFKALRVTSPFRKRLIDQNAVSANYDRHMCDKAALPSVRS